MLSPFTSESQKNSKLLCRPQRQAVRKNHYTLSLPSINTNIFININIVTKDFILGRIEFLKKDPHQKDERQHENFMCVSVCVHTHNYTPTYTHIQCEPFCGKDSFKNLRSMNFQPMVLESQKQDLIIFCADFRPQNKYSITLFSLLHLR